MVLIGKGNPWTDHVSEFARQRGISYMCAMSDPDCSLEYQYKKSKSKPEKKSRAKKGAKREEAPAKDIGELYPEIENVEGSTGEELREKLGKKAKKSKDKAVGMTAEDIISNLVSRVESAASSAPAASAVPQARSNAGRPKKYASVEEAKKAKSQKTMEAAKRRAAAKREAKAAAKAEKAAAKAERAAKKAAKEGSGKLDDVLAAKLAEHEMMESEDKLSKRLNKPLPKRTLQAAFDEKMKKKAGRPRKAAQAKATIERIKKEVAVKRGAKKSGKGFTAAQGEMGIDRPANADFGDPLSGGRRRRRGIGAFFNAIGDAARVVNPMTYLISNKKTAKAMSDLGQVTNNNLLPAVVSVGKPLYDAAAVTGSTLATGNPILGKVAADSLWNRMAAPYDPRKRQTSPELKQLSEMTGKELAKYGKMSAAGWNPFDWGYKLGHDVIGPALLGKGYDEDDEMGGGFDFLGALKSIGHAVGKPFEVLSDHPETLVGLGFGMRGGMINPFADTQESPEPKFHILPYPPRRTRYPVLGSDPHTWTPQGLSQGGAALYGYEHPYGHH